MENMFWRSQQLRNIKSFMSDDKFEEIRNILIRISEELVFDGWELFGAVNLFFHGLVDKYGELDILVTENSFERIAKILKNEFNATCIKDIIERTNFVNEVGEVDYFNCRNGKLETQSGIVLNLISGVRIDGMYGERFSYTFKNKEVDVFSLNGHQIPFMVMEVQFLVYEMNEGLECEKRYKRLRVKEYLEAEGIRHKSLLKSLLETNRLSSWIKEEVETLLEKAR